MAADKLKSKLSLYMFIIVLLSLTFQTSTARRSEMLPLPNNTTSLPPPTNDTNPFPINDNNTTQTTDYNDPAPLLFSQPPEAYTDPEVVSLAPQYNTEKAAETNDGFSSPPPYHNQQPPALAPPLEDQNDVVFSPEYEDPEIVSLASPPPYNPNQQTPSMQDQNDVVLTPEYQDPETTISLPSPPPYHYNQQTPSTLAPQNDVVFSSPPPYLDDDDQDDNTSYYSPVPSTAPEYEYFPYIAPVYDTDYDDDYFAPDQPQPDQSHPEVFPFTYEADDEVDPELAEDIQAYNDSAAQRGSGTVVVALGAVCLIGLGGFIYKKRKNEKQRKSQYQYLNKRDDY